MKSPAPTDSFDAMLQVQNIQQYYGGSHILRDVSFQATRGKVSVILGRNGVGKTTLLKSLMGLVAIKTGSIEFDGHAVERATPYERARAGMGYVPQGREIFPRLTVEENLAFWRDFLGGGSLEAALEAFALSRFASFQVGLLSAGQKRRLALARRPPDGAIDDLITDCYGSADFREGVTAFLEKRPAQFTDRVTEAMPEWFPWWQDPRYE